MLATPSSSTSSAWSLVIAILIAPFLRLDILIIQKAVTKPILRVGRLEEIKLRRTHWRGRRWWNWGTILPLSAQPIFVKRKYRGITEPSSSSSSSWDRLININNIIDPDFQSADGGLSILATRPPPSRFLNLIGIDSEAYSIAYVTRARCSDVRTRMLRFERTVFDAWGVSGARRARRAANAHPNADTAMAEPAHTPPSPGVTSTTAATSEQRANYGQEAARMQDDLAVFGLEPSTASAPALAAGGWGGCRWRTGRTSGVSPSPYLLRGKTVIVRTKMRVAQTRWWEGVLSEGTTRVQPLLQYVSLVSSLVCLFMFARK
ncbi:hypothetical protein D9619_007197 [Psilocybe cf. subviscida]|uniref:Uncharacterized protein n=1 Tax=Psilocybe cf. subviscida TaxID=2480587 RepID=A0A8H5B2D9_9AGAR|nr:hypothetical protein D9619_007197 [Psilocybe cf. subviscida]